MRLQYTRDKTQNISKTRLESFFRRNASPSLTVVCELRIRIN